MECSVCWRRWELVRRSGSGAGDLQGYTLSLAPSSLSPSLLPGCHEPRSLAPPGPSAMMFRLTSGLQQSQPTWSETFEPKGQNEISPSLSSFPQGCCHSEERLTSTLISTESRVVTSITMLALNCLLLNIEVGLSQM